MTSRVTPKSTSSQAPGSGPLQLDLLAGLTIAPSGPPPAPASPSRRPAKVSASMIQGICGQTWIDSSVEPASEASDPLSLWESRLRERLATIGSTECALIWRSKDTGLGWSISRLAPWTPPISASGSTGAPWVSPQAADGSKGSLGPRPHDTGASLPQQISASMGRWPSPRVSAGKGLGKPERGLDGGNCRLEDTIAMASWVTPSARDWKDSTGMSATGTDPDGSTRTRLDQLPRQMAATAPHGPTTNGSSATMAKRGAPNPDFGFWLMGWPAEFRRGVLAAIASLPRSRRKSSHR